jgi:hypothetical protein
VVQADAEAVETIFGGFRGSCGTFQLMNKIKKKKNIKTQTNVGKGPEIRHGNSNNLRLPKSRKISSV